MAYVRDPTAAADKKHKCVGRLSVNMQPVKPDPKQLEWWHSTAQLAAIYASFAVDAKPPGEAMEEIREWLLKARTAGNPDGCPPYANVYMVAMPTIFDGSLLYAYWMRFIPPPSDGKGSARGTGMYAMIDVRSYGAGRLGCSYAEANKTRALAPYMPADKPHTHTGVDDAEEQLLLLFNLMDMSPVITGE